MLMPGLLVQQRQPFGRADVGPAATVVFAGHLAEIDGLPQDRRQPVTAFGIVGDQLRTIDADAGKGAAPHAAIRRWIEEAGLHAGEPVREYYLQPPRSPNDQVGLMEIQYPLQRAG